MARVLGVELIAVGIRDMIAPGETKDLMNRVTEANIIARREETAAMRSQANPAKPLADNPTLMRLRELEVLEKVAANLKLNILLGDKRLFGCNRFSDHDLDRCGKCAAFCVTLGGNSRVFPKKTPRVRVPYPPFDSLRSLTTVDIFYFYGSPTTPGRPAMLTSPPRHSIAGPVLSKRRVAKTLVWE
jgi:hypothetical protein